MLITLTRITKVLTAQGEKKMEEYEKIYSEDFAPVDEYDRTADWYVEQGMTVPEELKFKDPYEGQEFVDSDYKEKESIHVCNVEALAYIDEYNDKKSIAKSTLVYQANIVSTSAAGYIFASIKETPKEVLKLINK